MNQILETEELRRITGYDRAADIERNLNEHGIKVFRGKGGMLWTTLDLINRAGGLSPPAENHSHTYDPEEII